MLRILHPMQAVRTESSVRPVAASFAMASKWRGSVIFENNRVPMTQLVQDAPNTAPTWRVYVLCAQWCGVCRDYRTFVTAQQALAAQDWVWVDVEEHGDTLDDLDVENFPTLLVAQGNAVHFLGTVLPQPDVALRLVQSLVQGNRYTVPALTDPDKLLSALRHFPVLGPEASA